MFDIPGSRWSVLRRPVARRSRCQQLKKAVNTGLGAARDIDHFSGGIRSFAGKQIRAHTIADIGEIARLLSVSEDRARLFFQHLPDKKRDHGGILEIWVLARSIDVEITQNYRFQ